MADGLVAEAIRVCGGVSVCVCTRRVCTREVSSVPLLLVLPLLLLPLLLLPVLLLSSSGRLADMASQMGVSQATGPLGDLSKGVSSMANMLGAQVRQQADGLGGRGGIWLIEGGASLPRGSHLVHCRDFAELCIGMVLINYRDWVNKRMS